jgi:uncharacterized protein involved in oxidation of intracellular sulfur
MKSLVIINDPPYGTERAYNGLRIATALLKRPGAEARLFLLGDGASCAKAGQKVPQGYYSLERMLRVFHSSGGEIGVCGTCMDARGLTDEDLGATARRSTLDELAEWTVWADRVLVF